MSKYARWRGALVLVLFAAIGLAAACGRGGPAGGAATATPTRTPRPAARVGAHLAPTPELPAIRTAAPTASPTHTAAPSPTATAIPASATPVPPTATEAPATATRAPAAAPAPHVPPTRAPTAPPVPAAPAQPQVDFAITELRVLGLAENNGGIEGAGSQHIIFINVLDAAGNPLDGARIVNTVAEYPGEAISGDKGPGKAEITLWRDVFRLKVESVGGAPVTSEVSHNLSVMDPDPRDIVGKLGDYCTTLDNCPLPTWKHFSYVITFRKTH